MLYICCITYHTQWYHANPHSQRCVRTDLEHNPSVFGNCWAGNATKTSSKQDAVAGHKDMIPVPTYNPTLIKYSAAVLSGHFCLDSPLNPSYKSKGWPEHGKLFILLKHKNKHRQIKHTYRYFVVRVDKKKMVPFSGNSKGNSRKGRWSKEVMVKQGSSWPRKVITCIQVYHRFRAQRRWGVRSQEKVGVDHFSFLPFAVSCIQAHPLLVLMGSIPWNKYTC